MSREGIFKRGAELYEQGHSLQAISRELKVPRSSIREILISGGTVLRPHSWKPRKKYDWSQKNYTWPKPAIRNAPYVFYLSQGKLKPDSREQEIIQIILELCREGKSHGAIARELNYRNIKPRKAKKWSQPTVGFIIKRHQKQNENKEK